jgi:hypothetical protein
MPIYWFKNKLHISDLHKENMILQNYYNSLNNKKATKKLIYVASAFQWWMYLILVPALNFYIVHSTFTYRS